MNGELALLSCQAVISLILGYFLTIASLSEWISHRYCFSWVDLPVPHSFFQRMLCTTFEKKSQTRKLHVYLMLVNYLCIICSWIHCVKEWRQLTYLFLTRTSLSKKDSKIILPRYCTDRKTNEIRKAGANNAIASVHPPRPVTKKITRLISN